MTKKATILKFTIEKYLGEIKDLYGECRKLTLFQLKS